MTGEQIGVLEGHAGWVSNVAFSPDSRLLASSSDDNTIRIWDVAAGEQIAILEECIRGVRNVVFTPDGKKTLLTAVERTS